MSTVFKKSKKIDFNDIMQPFKMIVKVKYYPECFGIIKYCEFYSDNTFCSKYI